MKNFALNFFLLLSALRYCNCVSDAHKILACKMINEKYAVIDASGSSLFEGNTLTDNDNELKSDKRLVIVGDVHGSYSGLLAVLAKANITEGETCSWNPFAIDTILVQVGDIVDRGNEAAEAWSCLEKLQSESSTSNSLVIRLIGNHELWWLEGDFRFRNKQADTIEKVKYVVDSMKAGILSGKVVGSYVHEVNGIPILFTHSGLRPEFIDYSLKKNGHVTAKSISQSINDALTSAIESCHSYRCTLDDEIFQAGPDRGGNHIGGPFWTDYSVIVKAIARGPSSLDLLGAVQIVGHTMAYCPVGSNCAEGLTRFTDGMEAICVDGGMYIGARTFLELDFRQHFVRHQLMANGWETTDFTDILCK